ncbi:helix-turn-helix domain-containing protein [Aquibacillus albus]|uniref:Transcriptional regulator with XRE-family HTH domain n=1 Tax=Aquibacillus albus TaxID=1168171 RepID=A0ABS2N5M3_9BACI|nr:helix-turn-helix transcriptional regulator [Aquibacillus albus]MBM7573180.1 transcriptional regulator with XRE-family HTH domain [Aquibacillus albus]
MGAIEWGRRIKAYRKLKGYTQIQFAQKLGISVSIVGEIERGNRMPANELIHLITDVLDISIEELRPED